MTRSYSSMAVGERRSHLQHAAAAQGQLNMAAALANQRALAAPPADLAQQRDTLHLELVALREEQTRIDAAVKDKEEQSPALSPSHVQATRLRAGPMRLQDKADIGRKDKKQEDPEVNRGSRKRCLSCKCLLTKKDPGKICPSGPKWLGFKSGEPICNVCLHCLLKASAHEAERIKGS